MLLNLHKDVQFMIYKYLYDEVLLQLRELYGKSLSLKTVPYMKDARRIQMDSVYNHCDLKYRSWYKGVKQYPYITWNPQKLTG